MSNEPTTDPISEPVTGAAAMSTADAISVPEGAAAEPSGEDAAVPPADAEAALAAPAAATTPVVAAPTNRARLSVLAVGRRLLRMTLTVALLAGGAYAGWQAYLSNLPAPAIPGDPAVVGVATPPAVAELAAAISADDANAIRVALNTEMFSRYTSDMERFGIATVDGVTTLATYADGPRSATAIVIIGRSADRNPFTINLVVIAQDGLIVSLR